MCIRDRPIGERQPLEEYMWAEHPEKYDADGNLLLPETGISGE